MIFYHIHIMSFSSSNGYKLNSHFTCFQRGFIAQSIEHRTGIAKVMDWSPVGVFIGGFICTCSSYFILTARITFTCVTKIESNYRISVQSALLPSISEHADTRTQGYDTLEHEDTRMRGYGKTKIRRYEKEDRNIFNERIIPPIFSCAVPRWEFRVA